jgi:hypothetical protein
MNDVMYMAADGPQLREKWSDVWDPISSAFDGGIKLLAIIGVCLAVFAILKWVWDRRKGGGGGGQGLIWMMLIGATLAVPDIILPMILQLIDWIIEAVIALAGNVGL